MRRKTGLGIASLFATVAVAMYSGARVDAAPSASSPRDAVTLLAPPTAKPTHKPKPTPTPVPTPTPTPTPTPKPTPAPTAGATPTPRPTRGTPTPTPTATKAPTKTPTATRTPRATTAAPPGIGSPAPATHEAVAPGAVASPLGGTGELATSELLPDGGSGFLGIGGMLLAFGLVSGGLLFAFGRRRRSGAAAQVATATAGTGPQVVAPVYTGPVFRPLADEEEAGVPRWLRRSVRAERFWAPPRGTDDRPVGRRRPATFADGAPAGTRMLLRYDDVTILDGPSEVYARPVGRVHSGDEVVVVGLAADWAEVHTPSGVSGWLPSMTLVAVQAPIDGEPPRDPTQAAP